ncbi:MAG: hypothetical protein ORN58_00655 [Sediminibacterium sp.]|nr:hypothetical protein [Sediminibacterium sp.]
MGIITQPTQITNYCTSTTIKNNYLNLIIIDSNENGIGTIKRQWYKTNGAALINKISSKDTIITDANAINYNPGTGAKEAIEDTSNYYFVLLTYNGES